MCMFLVSMDVDAQDSLGHVDTSIEMTCEYDYNVQSGEGGFAAILKVGVDVPLWDGSEMQSSLLSFKNTRVGGVRGWSVVDDKQVFSNILLDENIALTVSLLGLSQHIGERLNVFLGLRNMNVDYFCSPYTSLFTNSSDGIFPTISSDFEVANYPTAAMCLHAEMSIMDKITVKNSLYNGRSSSDMGRMMRISPRRDGLIDIAQVDYHDRYFAGVLFSHGAKGKRDNYSLYAMVEQPLYHGEGNVGMLLQYGYSPRDRNNVYRYFGMGLVGDGFLCDADAVGIQCHKMLCNDGDEMDIELTYKCPLCRHIIIQPAVHFIRTNGENSTAAMLRAIVGF
jgi:hypothetical protein